MNHAPCAGCGRLIVWGTTPEGKRIPLDPAATVYSVSLEGICEKIGGFMVTHFATCRAANEFSGSRRREESGRG